MWIFYWWPLERFQRNLIQLTIFGVCSCYKGSNASRWRTDGIFDYTIKPLNKHTHIGRDSRTSGLDYAEIGDDIYEKNNNVEDLSVQVWLPCWSLQISFCWGEKKCIKEAKVGRSHRYTTAALVGIGLRKESLFSLFSFEIRTSALINVVYMAESKDMSQLSIG